MTAAAQEKPEFLRARLDAKDTRPGILGRDEARAADAAGMFAA
jgi:hypothetical protein